MRKMLSTLLGLWLLTGPSSAYIHGSASSGVAILSAQTGFADGTDHALLGVTTNTGSGTWFYDISTSCGLSPTAAQVKAGTVTGSVVASSQAVSASGVQAGNPTGLSALTAYCAYYVQNTAAGDSNVVATTSFTTGAAIAFTPTFATGTQAWPGGGYTTVINDILAKLANCFTAGRAVTFTITFKIDSGCGLGCSTPNAFLPVSYNTTIRPQMLTIPNQNSQQRAAYAALPSTDPLGASDQYADFVGTSAARGINNGTNLGEVHFTNSTMDTSLNCSGSGFCLEGVAQHEVTETMGRFSYQQFGAASELDLFRYSAPGVRTGGCGGYSSADGGVTNVLAGNTLCNGDWGDENQNSYNTIFLGSYNGPVTDLLAPDIQYFSLSTGFGLTHSCRLTAGL